MTILIKSNVSATNSIGNIFNVNHNPNYSLLLDFGLQYYEKVTNNGRQKLSFNDVATFTRDGKATYIDETGEIVEVGKDVPRFTTDTDSYSSGLLLEAARSIILNAVNPVTKQYTMASGEFFALVHVEGSGSATLTGAASTLMKPATGSNMTVTQGKPVLFSFPERQDVNYTIEINGNVDRLSICSLNTASGINIKTMPAESTTIYVRPDYLELKESVIAEALRGSSSNTIVVKWTDNAIATESPRDFKTTSTFNNTVFSYISNSTAPDGVYASRGIGNERVSAAFVKNESGSTVTRNNFLKAAPRTTRDNTLAITFDRSNNKYIASINGVFTEYSDAYDINFTKLVLGSKNNHNNQVSLNGLLRQVVIYPFAMNYEDLQKVSLES